MRAVHFWSLQFLLTAPLAGALAAELKVTLVNSPGNIHSNLCGS
jgi:hypothetical protein